MKHFMRDLLVCIVIGIVEGVIVDGIADGIRGILACMKMLKSA